MERIFERFNQANSDTTRRFGGTGLGLSIVKSLVDMHGGSINLHSELGKGSVFTLLIPYQKPSPAEIASYRQEAPAENDGLLKGLRVLIVEDNMLNQKLAARILSDMGLTVEIAGHGKAAVDLLTFHHYDFVLMDMQMPIMDGYEAARIIRQDLKNNVPIIAMTAHAMQGEKERCLELGMNEYLAKPIRIKELYEKLVKVRRNETMVINSGNDFAPDENESGYDFSYLHQATGGDNEFIMELLGMAMRTLPSDLENLRIAVEEHNMPDIKYWSHKMRSSSALTGVHDLTTVLKTIESISSNDRSDGQEIPGLFAQVESFTQVALQVIRDEMEKRQAGAN
jgi:CheY-like chemotaxis protein